MKLMKLKIKGKISDVFLAIGFAKVDNGFGYEKWTRGEYRV